MRWASIFQLGLKELRGLRRDRVMLVLIVYSFTLSIYTQSAAVPETLNRAPIAVVDEDRSPLSERIVAAFYPPHFTTPRLIGRAEMDARMDAGLDTFALDIPPGFQRDVLAGRAPALQLNIDATRMTQAFSGGGYVQAIVDQEVERFLGETQSSLPRPAVLVLRARFNAELNKGWFGSVTAIISAVTMLAIILTGAALIREREHGTIEHLLVMPVRPTEIMLSKIWSMGLVVLVASAFSLVTIVQGLLAVPLQGSVPLFLAGAALDIMATTCLGIFLATVAGTMPQFGLLLMLVLLPLQILSGAVTPQESMPGPIQWIMALAPNTHFVSMAQAVLFRGAGLDVVWPQFVGLAVIAVVLFLLAQWRFRAFLR